MLSAVKPRGDTSVAFVRLGCTSRSRQTSATEYTVRSEMFSIRTTALESYAFFRCVLSAVQVSACLCKGGVNL